MIVSIKDSLMLVFLSMLLVFALVYLVRHARHADHLFGDLTETVQ